LSEDGYLFSQLFELFSVSEMFRSANLDLVEQLCGPIIYQNALVLCRLQAIVEQPSTPLLGRLWQTRHKIVAEALHVVVVLLEQWYNGRLFVVASPLPLH
jgi:hypothetical protein